MLTRLRLRNFKQFEELDIELGDTVVFIGPNNSGKTSALQALTLWSIGLRRWLEKRKEPVRASKSDTAKGVNEGERRKGVTINRRDVLSVPVPNAILLWKDLRVRDVLRQPRVVTRNVRIEIIVDGVDQGNVWTCGFEFDYANDESFYCRPLRLDDKGEQWMPIPDQARSIRLAFLPPMSGLAANELRLDPGAINVRLGEGRTAEVLRNLCFQVSEQTQQGAGWAGVKEQIRDLFGIELMRPSYLHERGEITMSYRSAAGTMLDISAAGRGLQQTLLILAHLAVNFGSVLLLDEPDAHLEILRQRQIYQVLTEAARRSQCQILAASHSEIILNEAAGRDMVIAFLGQPHRINDRGSQLLKSLRDYGFDHYYQAEQTGWVLYLEGSTDLAILSVFADLLQHPARDVLKRPFVHYVMNQPKAAREHFHALREAKSDLKGIALFDLLTSPLLENPALSEVMWSKREIENYFCTRDVLRAWANKVGRQIADPSDSSDHRQSDAQGTLFAFRCVQLMDSKISELEGALKSLRKGSPWDGVLKVTDEFLDPLFEAFFAELKQPNLMRKTNYHQLAYFLQPDAIDPEIRSVLDKIVEVAAQARGK